MHIALKILLGAAALLLIAIEAIYRLRAISNDLAFLSKRERDNPTLPPQH